MVYFKNIYQIWVLTIPNNMHEQARIVHSCVGITKQCSGGGLIQTKNSSYSWDALVSLKSMGSNLISPLAMRSVVTIMFVNLQGKKCVTKEIQKEGMKTGQQE